MSRYIDADELHNQGWVAARYKNWEPTPLNDNFRLEVEVKPFITFYAADVEEVKHGRWVEFSPLRNMFSCSLCGQWGDRLWNYCPNCGSRMDLDGDTE